jgi:hypothetical protein
MRVNFVLDEVSHDSAKMNRPFSTSALIRFWLKVLFYSEKDLLLLKREDEEFAAILHYVMPKVKKVFGE